MSRPIDADKLQQELEESGYRDDYILSQLLEEQPTVDAVPVVHGRWKVFQPDKDFPHFTPSYYCSVCGKNSAFVVDGMEPIPPQLFNRLIYRYCPHCGAKMDLEEV